jgi:nicotinate phosphoribosyltransferase
MDKQILTSILDNDDYKFKMGQVVFTDFPKAVVAYEFINRGKTEFPEGFADALKVQIESMSVLALTDHEAAFLLTLPGIRPNYVSWFKSYRYDSQEVLVTQDGGNLSVLITGYWFRTIYWEAPLMALISELYFKMTGQKMDSESGNRLTKKNEKMDSFNCQWIDFGTRRRFSYFSQTNVVYHSKRYRGFLGTSNVHLAHKWKVKCYGTSAHEMVMGLSALYGVRQANIKWMEHWTNHFRGLNGVALTDTFTTESFLKDFDGYWARLFDGLRQDSGDPDEWAKKVLTRYNHLGVSTHDKKLFFSDGLNDDLFIHLSREWSKYAQVVGGIGTFLTNDCGVKPLNMVIKMIWADFGFGPVDVVKLSDNGGKHTGKPTAILQAKQEIGIPLPVVPIDLPTPRSGVTA